MSSTINYKPSMICNKSNFITTNINDFVEILSDDNQCCEILYNEKCKLYIDYDRYIFNSNIDVNQILNDLKTNIKSILRKYTNNPQLYILSACRNNKISFHIYANVYFKNKLYVKKFVNDNFDDEFIDKNIYGNCLTSATSLRCVNSTKGFDKSTKLMMIGKHKRIRNYIISDITNCQYIPYKQYSNQRHSNKKSNKSNIIYDAHSLTNTEQRIVDIMGKNKFTFREKIKDSENIIAFNTTNEYYCKICAKTHKSENPYVYYDNDNQESAFLHCRHNPKYSYNIFNKLENIEIFTETTNTTHFTSRYISESVEIKNNKSKILIIQSPVDTGKTTYIKNLLSNSDNINKKILHISHRISMIDKTISDMAQNNITFTDYRDTKNIDRDKFICCINSLSKVSQSYDIIIMDEITSIIKQLLSMENLETGTIFNKLMRLIKRANHVICLDNTLTDFALTIFENEPDTIIFINDFKHTNKKLKIFSDRNKFDQQLNLSVNNQNKNFICSDSRKKILQYFDINKSDDKLLYTSHEGDILTDCNSSWENVKNIYASPSITTGISYDYKDFDDVYGLYTFNSCDVYDIYQQLNRIRFVKNNINIHILNDKHKKTPFKNIDDVSKYYLDIINNDYNVFINTSLNVDIDASEDIVLSNENLYNKAYFKYKLFVDHLSENRMTSLIDLFKKSGVDISFNDITNENVIYLPDNTEISKKINDIYNKIFESMKTSSELENNKVRLVIENRLRTIKEKIPNIDKSINENHEKEKIVKNIVCNDIMFESFLLYDTFIKYDKNMNCFKGGYKINQLDHNVNFRYALFFDFLQKIKLDKMKFDGIDLFDYDNSFMISHINDIYNRINDDITIPTHLYNLIKISYKTTVKDNKILFKTMIQQLLKSKTTKLTQLTRKNGHCKRELQPNTTLINSLFKLYL